MIVYTCVFKILKLGVQIPVNQFITLIIKHYKVVFTGSSSSNSHVCSVKCRMIREKRARRRGEEEEEVRGKRELRRKLFTSPRKTNQGYENRVFGGERCY